MSEAFGRDALLDAFDQIGRAAALAGTKLQIAVYGGSALMLASNFRFATEHVDVSELERPLPGWLAAVVDKIEGKWLAGRLVQRWGRLSPQLSRGSCGRSFGVWNISARRGYPAGACGLGSIGRIFAGPKIESGAGDGPYSRRNGTARYSQSDESRRYLNCKGSCCLAWPILPGERRVFRKAAISIEEYES